MKRLLAGSFFVAAVAVIACGGTIEGQNKTPPLCSEAKTCSNGDTCRMVLPGCPGEAPSELSCACSNGSFACPDIGRAPCKEPPPKPPGWREVCGFAGKVNDGEECLPEEKGDTCESFRQPTCEDPLPKVQCTCDGQKFVCGLPPKCPPPSTVDAGTAD